MQIYGQQFWNSWYVISILEKDICQCGASVQTRGKSPKGTSESTCKPARVHKARRKLSQDQLHTVIGCSVGEGVGILKAYIQVSRSRWSRSLWEKPQGTLVQHLMSLSALPVTVPLPFSPEYEPSFPLTEMLCTTLQSPTNIYRELSEWMQWNSCSSFQLIAHLIPSSPPLCCHLHGHVREQWIGLIAFCGGNTSQFLWCIFLSQMLFREYHDTLTIFWIWIFK